MRASRRTGRQKYRRILHCSAAGLNRPVARARRPARNSTTPPVRLAATSIPLPRPPWNARCMPTSAGEARIGPRRRSSDVFGPHSGPGAQRRGARPKAELRVAARKRRTYRAGASHGCVAAPRRSRYRRARRRSRRRVGTSGLFARPSAFVDGSRVAAGLRASRRHSGRSRAREPARPRARRTHRARRACPVRAPRAALSAAPRRARAGSTARRARRARRATQPRRAVSPRRDKSPSLAGPRRS